MFENLKKIYKKIINIFKSKNKVYALNAGKGSNESAIDSSKNKLEVYPVDEKEAQKILEELKKCDPDSEVSIEEIKNNYSQYKALQEQGKLKYAWTKKNIPSEDFVEIISNLTEEDMEYLAYNYMIGPKATVNGIYDMGLDRFKLLKKEGKLNEFGNYKNFPSILVNMPKEEKDYFKKLSNKNMNRKSLMKKFYLYHYFFKTSSKEKIQLFMDEQEDTYNYMAERASDLSTGYRWSHNIITSPFESVIALTKHVNYKDIRNLQEKTGVRLCMIYTCVLHLGTLPEETEQSDLEKMIINYNKLNLNLPQEMDTDTVKEMLLSLPNDIDQSYEALIKKCLSKPFKIFNIRNFEQVKNYEQICNQKIQEEFSNKDDVDYLRNLILKTKFENLDNIKRDTYFYKKYIGEKAKENEIYTLFNKLFNSEKKEEILDAYNGLMSKSQDFTFDNLIGNIGQQLAKISKNDVVSKMTEMQERLKQIPTSNINGKEVLNLTGRDFNLLISVIGSLGSPYLVKYYNSVGNLPISRKAQEKIAIKGIKRRINKRFKLDPLKNKQRCVSSIDEDFLGHIPTEIPGRADEEKQYEEKLALVYFPKQAEDIYWMGTYDLMTIYDKKRSDPTRKRVPHKSNMDCVCNLKLDDLNSSTIGDDNEIVIDSYPGAVICFDKVSNIAEKTARKLGVPPLYIDSNEQLKIIKQRLESYYNNAQIELSQDSSISTETFEDTFNEYEKDNNIIHRAFKFANGFTYLDFDEYPDNDVIEVFDKMKKLVKIAYNKANPRQKGIIRNIMAKEADRNNIRYGKYGQYIDLEELVQMVSDRKEDEQVER